MISSDAIVAALGDARLEHLQAIRHHWNDLLVPLTWAAATAAVAGGVLGAVALSRWLRTRGQGPQPLGVFRTVARAAGLSLAEQWLLVRVARAEALPSPLTLLLSRQTLRVHATRYAAALPASRRLGVLTRVRHLRGRVFDGWGLGVEG